MKSVIQNSSVTGYSNKRRFVPNNGLGHRWLGPFSEQRWALGGDENASTGSEWVGRSNLPYVTSGCASPLVPP